MKNDKKKRIAINCLQLLSVQKIGILISCIILGVMPFVSSVNIYINATEDSKGELYYYLVMWGSITSFILLGLVVVNLVFTLFDFKVPRYVCMVALLANAGVMVYQMYSYARSFPFFIYTYEMTVGYYLLIVGTMGCIAFSLADINKFANRHDDAISKSKVE